MKRAVKICILGVVATLTACAKGDGSGYAETSEDFASEAVVSDSISQVASLSVTGRQFIKTAEVDMEVKEVYAATIAIEKLASELGGFSTKSDLHTRVVSEDTYNRSDTEAVLVRKYRMGNSMLVQVPTNRLAEFLQGVNDQSIFLNGRLINAEDVTAALKYAKMETERNKKTASTIAEVQRGKDKVNLVDNNLSEKNDQALEGMQMADNLNYSAVSISLTEPQLGVAKLPVVNTRGVDNQYKYNFLYDVKNAFVQGFYLLQILFVNLIKIWPVLLVMALLFYLLRKRKTTRDLSDK